MNKPNVPAANVRLADGTTVQAAIVALQEGAGGDLGIPVVMPAQDGWQGPQPAVGATMATRWFSTIAPLKNAVVQLRPWGVYAIEAVGGDGLTATFRRLCDTAWDIAEGAWLDGVPTESRLLGWIDPVAVSAYALASDAATEAANAQLQAGQAQSSAEDAMQQAQNAYTLAQQAAAGALEVITKAVTLPAGNTGAAFDLNGNADIVTGLAVAELRVYQYSLLYVGYLGDNNGMVAGRTGVLCVGRDSNGNTYSHWGNNNGFHDEGGFGNWGYYPTLIVSVGAAGFRMATSNVPVAANSSARVKLCLLRIATHIPVW